MAEATEWIAEWERRWSEEAGASWAITNGSGPRVIGQIGFRSLYLADGQAECSYWVLPRARRARVATRATRALTRWAFDHLGLHRIEITHSVRNAWSCKVADNADFVLEGTKRSQQLHRDGWHDMHLHARVSDS